MSDFDSALLRLGSTEIAYRRVGSGPDVVFVHGWPLHRETWRGVVDSLPGYTCHLFDLPGAGATKIAPGSPLSFDVSVDATLAVVDHLELDDFALVGHDSGGLIARKAAARCGDRVRAMVLTGTEIPGQHPPLITALAKAAALPGAATLLRRVLLSRRLTGSKFVFGGTLADRDLLDGEFRRLFIEPLISDRAMTQNALALLRSYTPAQVDELRDVHPQLKMPILAIWGRRDPFFPIAEAEAMMEQFAGPTEFVVFDEARLFVHEDEPARFAAQTDAFLARRFAER